MREFLSAVLFPGVLVIAFTWAILHGMAGCDSVGVLGGAGLVVCLLWMHDIASWFWQRRNRNG